MTARKFYPGIDPIPRPRGRPPIGERAFTRAESRIRETTTRPERKRAAAIKRRELILTKVAVLDFETDPFSDTGKDELILPFCACLYADTFDPVVIWEENFDAFIGALLQALDNLPGDFTIYAHNGGRFDFMFFVSKLRGQVSFKGRGIMSARIGRHELRDSFHIIPEALAGYHKEAFDYSKMRRSRRKAHRKEIIEYMVSDCRYLLQIVKAFVNEFGLKLSIGQAAMSRLKSHYPEIKSISENFDAHLRKYFYGGRVECLKGRGRFSGDYKLFDVNSLYPAVMAGFAHPIGDFWDYKIRRGAPGPDTVFIDLNCRNRGALIGKNEAGETTARISQGQFFTTIWEYNVATKYDLISDVTFNWCLDCKKRTDFSKHVIPIYEGRQGTKAELQAIKINGGEETAQWFDAKQRDMFLKFLLNTGYGKFAQNPRKFKDHYITDPDETPPAQWFWSLVDGSKRKLKGLPVDVIWQRVSNDKLIYTRPTFQCEEYLIWEKPAPMFRFHNVGVAASITGAARAVLLEALQHAEDAIYCDTDSIICKSLSGVQIDDVALGAWAMEDQFTEVVINGKKLYSTRFAKAKKRSPDDLAKGLSPEYGIKAKGASRFVYENEETRPMTWADMLAVLTGSEIITKQRAPTLTRYGEQFYSKRTMRATAPIETATGV